MTYTKALDKVTDERTLYDTKALKMVQEACERADHQNGCCDVCHKQKIVYHMQDLDIDLCPECTEILVAIGMHAVDMVKGMPEIVDPETKGKMQALRRAGWKPETIAAECKVKAETVEFFTCPPMKKKRRPWEGLYGT